MFFYGWVGGWVGGGWEEAYLFSLVRRSMYFFFRAREEEAERLLAARLRCFFSSILRWSSIRSWRCWAGWPWAIAAFS